MLTNVKFMIGGLMLDFWFNPAVSKLQKLLFLGINILIAVGLYLLSPMPTPLIGLFLGVGIIFLICRFCKIHLTSNNPRHLLYRIFTWIPLALLCAIFFLKAPDHLLDWGIQGLAFMVIGICVCSLHMLKNK